MRVLIIDDHPALRMRLRLQILKEWSDAEVLEAPTLARGMALAQGRNFELLVLDRSLPDACGETSLAQTLKIMAGVPALVLSHELDRAQASRLLQMGVAACLAKSQLELEFMPAVHRLLAGGRYITASLAGRFPSFPDFPGLDHGVAGQRP